MENYSYNVKQIKREDCSDFILNIHYAKRWPSISYAYGLFRDDELVGVITYGCPPSPNVRNGVAGVEYAKNVIELNRLSLRDNLKCEASRLIGGSLKLLPKPKIVLSFADTSMGHEGTVYKATNFGYYGLSAKRTDWKIKGKEHLHMITISDEFRGTENRSKAIREKYGDDFYTEPRPRKHRYIITVGSKSWRKGATKAIKYEKVEF